jgi:hypothetical protein
VDNKARGHRSPESSLNFVQIQRLLDLILMHMVYQYMKEVLLVFGVWIEAMDLCKNGLHLLFEFHYFHRVLFDPPFMPIKTHDMILLVSLSHGQFRGEPVYSFIPRRRYG